MTMTCLPAVARAAHVLAGFTPPPAFGEEHYFCMNEFCENAEIPQSNIRDAVDPKTGVRRVVARCPHCQRGYEIWFVKRGAQWQRSGVTLQLDPEPADPVAERLNEQPTFPRMVVTSAEQAALDEEPADAFDIRDFDDTGVDLPESLRTPDGLLAKLNDQAAEFRDEADVAGVVADARPERTFDPSTSQL